MEMCQRWAADGTLITVEQNLRLWAMMQQAGRMACDAVELLFKNAGTSVTRKGSRMERYFRDVQMYRVHPSSHVRKFLGAGRSGASRVADPAFQLLNLVAGKRVWASGRRKDRCVHQVYFWWAGQR